jgi:NAD(P) transhydrogenase subunit alpha
VPVTASRMLSSNLCSFVSHFWDKQAGRFVLNRDDEIIQSCLIAHEGQIVNPLLKAAIG